MSPDAPRRSVARWFGTALGLAGGAYVGYAAATWLRYGHPRPGSASEHDELLDQFVPIYDVVEHHRTDVEAPAAVTLDAARGLNLFELPIVRALLKTRELILGATGASDSMRGGLLDVARSIGWVVLAEVPGRELVVGTVTKPWEANVTFRSIAPEHFSAFSEPGYVKIAWTLRADPRGPSASTFRTETRAVATDAAARSRFRVYWAFLSPGIFLIRGLSLGPVRSEAERRAGRRPALAP